MKYLPLMGQSDISLQTGHFCMKAIVSNAKELGTKATKMKRKYIFSPLIPKVE